MEKLNNTQGTSVPRVNQDASRARAPIIPSRLPTFCSYVNQIDDRISNRRVKSHDSDSSIDELQLQSSRTGKRIAVRPSSEGRGPDPVVPPTRSIPPVGNTHTRIRLGGIPNYGIKPRSRSIQRFRDLVFSTRLERDIGSLDSQSLLNGNPSVLLPPTEGEPPAHKVDRIASVNNVALGARDNDAQAPVNVPISENPVDDLTRAEQGVFENAHEARSFELYASINEGNPVCRAPLHDGQALQHDLAEEFYLCSGAYWEDPMHDKFPLGRRNGSK